MGSSEIQGLFLERWEEGEEGGLREGGMAFLGANVVRGFSSEFGCGGIFGGKRGRYKRRGGR